MNNIIKLSNLGTVNKNVVDIGNLRLWFSYEIIVAFYHSSTGLVVSENVWSKTTGKFLNEIQSDKKKRIGRKLFENKLDALLSECRLARESSRS